MNFVKMVMNYRMYEIIIRLDNSRAVVFLTTLIYSFVYKNIL
jgi:hypothetical protein